LNSTLATITSWNSHNTSMVCSKKQVKTIGTPGTKDDCDRDGEKDDGDGIRLMSELLGVTLATELNRLLATDDTRELGALDATDDGDDTDIGNDDALLDRLLAATELERNADDGKLDDVASIALDVYKLDRALGPMLNGLELLGNDGPGDGESDGDGENDEGNGDDKKLDNDEGDGELDTIMLGDAELGLDAEDDVDGEDTIGDGAFDGEEATDDGSDDGGELGDNDDGSDVGDGEDDRDVAMEDGADE
jgi:hypothetical protein